MESACIGSLKRTVTGAVMPTSVAPGAGVRDSTAGGSSSSWILETRFAATSSAVRARS
jgi:hypothetical protein